MKNVPFGWEVDVHFYFSSGRPDQTFHYRGCTEKAARRKALLKTHADRVLAVRPVSKEAWIRTYGLKLKS
jgi:hypothetical protein